MSVAAQKVKAVKPRNEREDEADRMRGIVRWSVESSSIDQLQMMSQLLIDSLAAVSGGAAYDARRQRIRDAIALVDSHLQKGPV